MDTLLMIIGVLALQFILQFWLFPRLGVST